MKLNFEKPRLSTFQLENSSGGGTILVCQYFLFNINASTFAVAMTLLNLDEYGYISQCGEDELVVSIANSKFNFHKVYFIFKS